jgi:TP901 family phage tail tape measure protein
MAQDQQMNIIVRMVDNTTSALRGILGQFGSLKTEATAAGAAVDRLPRKVSSVTGALAGMAAKGALAVAGFLGLTSAISGLIGAVREGIAGFAAFDDAIREAGAKANATTEDMKAMRAQAAELGETTSFSASQAAEGMTYLAMAGLDAQEVMAAMPGVLKLAAAEHMELARAADIATNIMSQTGQGVEDLSHILDTLAYASSNSNTNIEGLGLAMQYAGGLATGANQTFEETAAVLAVLADAGVRGERAGTALRGAFTQLLHGTKEQTEALDALGVSITDSLGAMRPMGDILRDLAMAGADAGDMVAIFGSEAGAQLANTMTKSIQRLDEFRNGIELAGGTAERLADQMEAGLGGEVRRLNSLWESFTNTLGEDFGAPIVSGLSSVVDGLKEAYKYTKDWGGYWATTFASGLLAVNWATVAGGIGTVTTAAITAAGALRTFGAAMLWVVTKPVQALLVGLLSVRFALSAINPLAAVLTAAAAAIGYVRYRLNESNIAYEATGKLLEQARQKVDELAKAAPEAARAVRDLASGNREATQSAMDLVSAGGELGSALDRIAKGHVSAAQEYADAQAAQRQAMDQLRGAAKGSDAAIELEAVVKQKQALAEALRGLVSDEKAWEDALSRTLEVAKEYGGEIVKTVQRIADGEVTAAATAERLREAGSPFADRMAELAKLEISRAEIEKKAASVRAKVREQTIEQLKAQHQLLAREAIDLERSNSFIGENNGKLAGNVAQRKRILEAIVGMREAGRAEMEEQKAAQEVERERALQARERAQIARVAREDAAKAAEQSIKTYEDEAKAIERAMDLRQKALDTLLGSGLISEKQHVAKIADLNEEKYQQLEDLASRHAATVKAGLGEESKEYREASAEVVRIATDRAQARMDAATRASDWVKGKLKEEQDELKRLRKEAEDEHKRSADVIQSIDDAIRDKRRQGMDEEAQQQDILTEAREKAAQARKALDEGNASAARDLAQEAASVFQQVKDINTSVKGLEGVRKIATEAAAAIDKQQQALIDAQEAQVRAVENLQRQIQTYIGRLIEAIQSFERAVQGAGPKVVGVEADTSQAKADIQDLTREEEKHIRARLDAEEARRTELEITRDGNKTIITHANTQPFDSALQMITSQDGTKTIHTIAEHGAFDTDLAVIQEDGHKRIITEADTGEADKDLEGVTAEERAAPIIAMADTQQAVGELDAVAAAGRQANIVATSTGEPARGKIAEIAGRDWRATIKIDTPNYAKVMSAFNRLTVTGHKTILIHYRTAANAGGPVLPVGLNGGGSAPHPQGQLPGYGTRDTVPAILTPGEFITRAPATKAISSVAPGLLDAMNRVSTTGDARALLDKMRFDFPEPSRPSISGFNQGGIVGGGQDLVQRLAGGKGGDIHISQAPISVEVHQQPGADARQMGDAVARAVADAVDRNTAGLRTAIREAARG